MTDARRPFPPRGALASAALALVLLAGCDSVEERIQGHLERGAALVEEGQPEKAKLEYLNAIKLDQDNVEARLELAKLFEDQGEFGRAVGHYVVAVENDAANVEARVRLAQYMLVSGKVDRALEVAQEAYELAPDDPDVLAVRASTAYQVGDDRFALELATKAVEIEPLHAAASVVLISDRVEQGQLDEALAMTDAILAVHEDDLSLQLLRLRLLEAAGRADAVLDQLEYIVSEFPDVVAVRRALAERYASLGEYEKAEVQLRDIAASAQDKTEARLDIVRFRLRVEGLDAAVAELRDQIDASAKGETWPLREALAELLYDNDRQDEARAVMTRVAESGSNDASLARVVLARYAISEGDVERGEALIDAALEGDRANVDALAIRGAIQLERGEHGAAIETLRTGLTTEPNDVRLLLLSGRAHLRAGNEALGSDQLATATRVSDYAPQVAQEYVGFLLSQGRLDGAEAVLSEAARRAPDNRAVLSALAELRLRQQDWVGAETVAAQLRELEGGGDTAEDIVAASLSGQERFDESAAVLRGLLEQGGGNTRRLRAFVANLVAAERTSEARDFVERVLADNPDNRLARMIEVELAERLGERERAIELLEAMRADFPDSGDVYLMLARYEMQEGDLVTARVRLREGLAAAGDDLRIRLTLASLLERAGDYEDALEQYEAVYEAQPDSVIAANNLASTLAEHFADRPGALERARAIAARLEGTEVPEMQDTLGWVLYLTGEYEAALGPLERAAGALPDNAFVQYHLGMAYAANDRPEDARRHLERALTLAADQRFTRVAEAEEALAALGSN
ncbi:MAG: tetratricopeptide repeat protein [Paracoccaceae bacterium]